jgi:hypothetical protein
MHKTEGRTEKVFSQDFLETPPIRLEPQGAEKGRQVEII